MADVVPGFPLNLFKPPPSPAQVPLDDIVEESNTLTRSGSLTPLGEISPGRVDSDDDLGEPFFDFFDIPDGIESIQEWFERNFLEVQILIKHELQNHDCLDYDTAAVTEILSSKREIRLDLDIWPAEKGSIVSGIRNTKIVRAIGEVKKFADRLNKLGKTNYFVGIVGAHHGKGQNREAPGLPYCCFLFDKEKGTKETRMYRCGIRKQFDGPKFAMLDKDIERIVLGEIEMPNGIKEKPILPLVSKKLEEEYLKLWSSIQPKKESRNPKPEIGSKKRKRIAKPECGSTKRKRITKPECGTKKRKWAAGDYFNGSKLSSVLEHEGNVVEDDTDDEEDSSLEWDSPSNEY